MDENGLLEAFDSGLENIGGAPSGIIFSWIHFLTARCANSLGVQFFCNCFAFDPKTS
jgi:hypothetical protein